MDMIPTFQSIMNSKLFTLPYIEGNGWCGYLLGRYDTIPDDSITVTQSFKNFNGHYLFSPSVPSFSTEDEVNGFIDTVRYYLDKRFGSPTFDGCACLWITDLNNLTGSNCQAFTFGALAVVVLLSDFNNAIGSQITFSIPQNTLMSCTDTGLCFKGSNTNIQFVTAVGSNGPTIDNNSAFLPLIGPYSGCFLIGGKIISNTLNYLNCGVRYHYSRKDGSIASQMFPIVDYDSSKQTLNYSGVLDPINHVNAESKTVDITNGKLRTFFAITGATTDDLQMNSWLKTDTNNIIGLVSVVGSDNSGQPLPNSGSFVFEYMNLSLEDQGSVYMTLAGDFGLAVESGAVDNTSYNLLCGLSGLETLRFRAYSKVEPFDRLRFIPRKGSYAPIFPFEKVSLNNPETVIDRKQLLDSKYRTSWVAFINGDGGEVTYSAQPDKSPLYIATNETDSGENSISILDSFEPTIVFPQNKDFAVPFVPYSSLGQSSEQITFDSNCIENFEKQILASVRKEFIHSAVLSDLSKHKAQSRFECNAEMVYATTPQGLIAEVTSCPVGTEYSKVILAKSQDNNREMAFYNLTAELQSVFQTNQLFMVAVNPKYLGNLQSTLQADFTDTVFQNSINIAGWTLAANVGSGANATDYRNVMIFKFRQGTIIDQISNPNKWSSASQFSVLDSSGSSEFTLTGLSNWLQNYMEYALNEAKENSLYENFKKIITDPDWKGILVLRADVITFPSQLSGLMSGVEHSGFEAHHFGISVNQIQVNGSNISLDKPSSMFGLIDYENSSFRQNVADGGNPDVPLAMAVSDDYAFTVLQLQVLFQNTSIVDFKSRVQLTVNKIFGLEVNKTYSAFGQFPSNAVVLKGNYCSQGNAMTYVFQQDKQTIFLVNSTVFNAIAFNRVQFNTLSSNTNIKSRFLIWGALNFVVLQSVKEKHFHTPYSGIIADESAICMGVSVKEKHFHTPYSSIIADEPAICMGVSVIENPFDILSFGNDLEDLKDPMDLGVGLSFSNLLINMESPIDTPNAVTFTFDAGNLAFDLSNSYVRENSLFPTFALELDSFIAASDDKQPSNYGYLPVQIAPAITAITGEWYGISFKINMGTPGALVSKVGFTSNLLIAWSSDSLQNNGYPIFVGLKLPGTAPDAKLMSLQGVLKVSMDSIVLQYDNINDSKKAFNLRLNNIGLKLLGIAKLPPGASINFFLFGDPDGAGSLGWYAAYKKDQAQQLLREFNQIKDLAVINQGEEIHG